MASRYDAFDNGAPTEDRLKFSTKNVGRSAHDFSMTHIGNTLLGAIVPVDCFDVVPSESLDINIAAILDFRNPTTRKLYNGFRVFFHTRYNRLSDLWEGAKNFLDEGRRGDIKLTRPNTIYHLSGVQDPTDSSHFYYSIDACTPLSLLNFLGLPPSSVHPSPFPPLRSFQPAAGSELVKYSNHTDFFPADCLMAYQRNWRDFYANKNLLQNNKYWFPDNEDHFILSYNATDCVCINYEDEDLSNNPVGDSLQVAQYFNLLGNDDFVYNKLSITPEASNPVTNISPDSYNYWQTPNLCGLKFAQVRGDRFSTASPFPDLLRGDMPLLNLTDDNFLRLNVVSSENHPEHLGNSYPVTGVSAYSTISGVGTSTVHADGESKAFVTGSPGTGNATYYSATVPSSSLTMSDIYTLETLTAFKRKLGMTNGDYQEFIESQFGGHNPRVHDRKGTYVGGFYVDFTTEGITQTSESSDSSPLGTQAGSGSAAGRGQIGHFEVPDYGWIQTYMFIVPDSYYTQGKPRQYSKQSSIDMYFPLFNNLPAQEIRNDELFITGDSSFDSQPFGYEDRFAEYKGRTNRVSGFIGLSPDFAAFDSARIMARRFESSPKLNSQFVTLVPENVDMSVFTVVDEPPFDFNVSVQVRRVFPGPYMAIEGSLSAPLLN